jgi:hypothetical protein
MNIRRFSKGRSLRIAGWAAAGVLSAGLVGGIAEAATSASAPAAPAASVTSISGHPARHAKGGLLRRAVRGQVTVRTAKGWVTFEFQRGLVTAVSGSQITVRDPQGHSVTYQVGPTTKVRRLGAASSVAAIQVGDRVLVIADGDPPTALRIRDAGPPGSRRPGGQTPASPTATT